MEKKRVLNHSLTQAISHPAYLMPLEPKLSLRNNVKKLDPLATFLLLTDCDSVGLAEVNLTHPSLIFHVVYPIFAPSSFSTLFYSLTFMKISIHKLLLFLQTELTYRAKMAFLQNCGDSLDRPPLFMR